MLTRTEEPWTIEQLSISPVQSEREGQPKLSWMGLLS